MNNFSFCSNLTEYNLVKQSDFTAISTSQNIIVRMKRIVSLVETEKKQSLVRNIPLQPEAQENNNTKKKVC